MGGLKEAWSHQMVVLVADGDGFHRLSLQVSLDLWRKTAQVDQRPGDPRQDGFRLIASVMPAEHQPIKAAWQRGR